METSYDIGGLHHNYFITPRNGVLCGEVTGVATCAKNEMTKLVYVHDSIPNQEIQHSLSVVLPLHLPAKQCSTVNICYFCYDGV